MLPAKYRLTTLLGVALLLQPSLAFGQAMLVYKKKEGQDKATTQAARSIRSATYKVVKYRLQGGGTQDIPADELQDVYPSDSYVRAGVRELNAGKITSAVRSLKRAANSNNDKIKPFGLYFYGLALQRAGQAGAAIKQYEAFLKLAGEHFYAPHATYNAGEISRMTRSFSAAEKYYGKLSKFGDAWAKKGSYGKAVSLLAQGKSKANAAKSAFSSLTGADEPIGSLAEVGVARALILLGQDSEAQRKAKKLTGRGNSAAAMGGGYLALGEIEAKGSKWRPALFNFMRSALLYGDQPSFVDARNGAAQAAKGLNAGGLAGRIMGAPPGYSYTGKKPDAEFVKQLMRFSAQLAGEHAQTLMKSASGEEKADLEFLYADSLKFTGKQAEYQKLMSELQKKYPKHIRAADVKADLLFTSKNDLARRWSEAKDETDSAKRKALVDKIQAEYKEAMAGFKDLAAGAVKECEPIEEIEDRTKYNPENVAKMRRRDTIELKYAEIVYDASKTYPEGDSDRAALLNTAYTLIDNFTLDRGENFSFDLLANAYKTKGLILLDQGKAKEAVEEFESLKEYVAPINVRDKKIMAEVKKFQDSIRISGYRLFAKACSKSGDNEKAIAAFTQLEESFPNYQNTREGLLAMFELTKCLAGAGRTTEALEKIYPIVEDPKSITVKGITPDALKIQACIALAGISDAAGGEIFPPEIQFQVGVGYKIRGDDEAAIVGYKGVLTSAVTKEEREKWVPRACQEMGILLYYQKRYLEAVLAYRVLFTEFPRHPKAGDAIKFARTAMNKALEVYSESESAPGPLIALKKKLDRALVNIGGGLAGATVILKEASKLQIARKYERAAKKYLEVPKTSEVTDEKTKKKRVIPVPFYPNAVANAGYCYFKAAERAKEGKRDELMAEAEKNLQNALNSAKKLDDSKSLALASYYLGELSNFKKEYDKAVNYLKPFDGKFKNMKNFKVRAKGQQITAFLALNKFSEAEARYKAVSSDPSITVTIMALDLADWFARAASKELSKGSPQMSTVQSYRSKAADYASDWITRSKKLKRTSLLWASSLIMDGQRYAKAVSVYERLFNEFPRPEINGKLLGKKAQAEAALHDQYDLAKMNLARAYLIAGKAKEAAKLFTELKGLVVIKKKNTLIARGEFIKEARETLRDDKGRPVRCRVYYVKEKSGEVTYFVPPRQSPSQVLKGKDASQSFAKRDLMTFRQRFKTNFIVLEGLADSVWGVYKSTGDKNYLVNEVQDAWNRFYLFMSRAVDEDRYKDMVTNYNLKETKYYEKLMTVALRILDIKWERGEFGDIISDVQSFEDNELIKEGTISDGLRNKILALKKRAENKK